MCSGRFCTTVSSTRGTIRRMISRFGNLIDISLEEVLKTLSSNSEIGMIHLPIFGGVFGTSLVHSCSSSFSLTILLEYNIMHIVVLANSSVVRDSTSSIKFVDPVLLCLTKNLTSIEFQFGKKDLFTGCNVSHKDLPLRRSCPISLTFLWNT